MAVSNTSLVALMAVALTVVSLLGSSLAADAPAPSPVSPAGAVSPSFALSCLVAVSAFLFGSALKSVVLFVILFA
ncbi:hypothetical protein RHSIM_Rhsim11G0047400 [Rhododendron simsii]|uniref:Uncharacterized protein n=1 Tax=Rhododendron simsii TaxID=118357 RepID=A0A834LBM3_RHOSS|nr:hypothetical protein RHSIM_Rhsim11G0047400 [Rhododendron simsii]